METRFTVLLIELGVALVVQVGILIAILAAVKKSTARMESLANEVQSRALPTLDAAQSLIQNSGPKLQQVISNLADSTTTLKGQLERVDATVNDIVDRTRLQIIRTDELVSRTLDRVEETTDIVHHTVISPVRQIAGIVSGVTAVVGSLFGGRREREHDRAHAHHDEMFI
jgi:methyl-accepting chemotaxis protein